MLWRIIIVSDGKIKFEDGEAYEQLMGVWSQFVGRQFLKWLAADNHQRWLDVGCGNGAFTEQIIKHCSPSKVHGIDPSGAQIEYAIKRPGVQSASFQSGDASRLPFDANQFDVAAMALVLFFVPDPMQSVKEMMRVVRPNGIVTAYVWDIHEGGFPLEPIHAEMRARKIKYTLPISSTVSKMENLKNLWVESGLKSVDTCVIEVKRTFKSFSYFWNVSQESGTLKNVFKELDETTKKDLRHATKLRLKLEGDEPFTIDACANAVSGIV